MSGQTEEYFNPRNELAKVAVDRPTQLINAIEEINRVTNRLENLVARTQGQERPETASEPVPPVALASLMEYGAKTIHQKLETQMQLLGEIEAILFG